MRLQISLLALILVFTRNLQADQPATAGKPAKADPAHIQKLIDKLGSASFSERDQATKALEAIGPAALVQLRSGAKSGDQEVNCRLARLIETLEERALTTAFLAPRRVRLKVDDVSVMQAVEELKRISGQPIDVTGDRTPLDAKKITLDTGDVAVWEALQILCEKGGMVEQPVARPIQQNGRNYYQIQPQAPANRSIVLMASTQKLPPTCLLGSVRVRILPQNTLNAPLPGEINVVFEVIGEQRLQGFSIVDTLLFEKCIDDHGQRLELAPDSPYNQQYLNPAMGRVFINGQPLNMGGHNPNAQRVAAFRFKRGDKGGAMLKELSGKLLLQALSPVETLVAIKDIRKAVGRPATGKDGVTLQVTKVETLDDGGVRLDVVIESPPEGGTLQNPFGNGNFMIGNFNGFNGNINGVQFINGVPANNIPSNFPKLVDAKGKKYQHESVSSRPEISNGLIVRRATLTYRPTEEASQMVLEGQRTVQFAVPISFKDVTLP